MPGAEPVPAPQNAGLAVRRCPRSAQGCRPPGWDSAGQGSGPGSELWGRPQEGELRPRAAVRRLIPRGLFAETGKTNWGRGDSSQEEGLSS